jgi:alpha-L-rhamnosidase
VEETFLDPAWTDFSKRVYYSEYDITHLIVKGTNCIGVSLGNGFFNPLPLRMWGRRNLREVLTTGRPVFIGKVIVDYKNGKTDVIITDDSWNFTMGPILKNNVYIGEVYDSGKEIIGWDKARFDDSSWEKAKPEAGPGGKLQKAFFPPVQITRRIRPVDIYSPEEGIYIADMGVNFTGIYRIRLKGNTGDTITFRFGERIYGDGSLNPMTTVCVQIKSEGTGGPGSPDIAWQTDVYIVGSEDETWYQPEFTFHTYRYMEIKGAGTSPRINDIEGLALNTNVLNNNSFSSSSELLNSIQQAIERTFLSNLISVQSDCAAREKFGYGGDLNATSEAFIYNFDMHSFYKKTVYDWADAINDSVFIDTAPYVGIRYCGLSWESAFITTQYNLFLYYNDVELVKEMYDLNKKWMDKAARIHPGGIVDKGLGDHESLEPVPVQLTGTCHYLLCARIMQKFSLLMNDEENNKKYRLLAKRLEEQIRKEFWEKPYIGKINRQTLFASLLYYDIIPPEEIAEAADSLMEAVRQGPSGHFTTGIFGTKYILEAMSLNISPGRVFDIVNSTEFPGWGHMKDKGATTIWETWKESDNTYSNCHPMFGTVTEWYYRWLGGIRPDPEYPGFRKFSLMPFLPEKLENVNCTYYSPYGRIVSNWRKEKNRTIYRFEIPEGTTARIDVGMNASNHIRIEKDQSSDFKQEMIKGLTKGNFELVEGKYTITVD